MTHLAYPYRFDARGRSAEVASFHQHVANLVEQTLLTTPGSRVNRPEFGAGLLEMVFEPGSDTLADATEFLVRSSLQRWLQDMVRIDALSVEVEDSTLIVSLEYLVLETGQTLSQDVRQAI